MKFSICGKSAGSKDSLIELRKLLPVLVSSGYDLSDFSNKKLCYGSTGEVDSATSGSFVVRWDDTCDESTLEDERVKAIVFSSEREERTWSGSVTNQKTFVFKGLIDDKNRAEDAPSGLLSIRSQFDKLFLIASPEDSSSDRIDECISAYCTLRASRRHGKTCLVLMLDEYNTKVRGHDVFRVGWLPDKERAALFSISSGLICASTRREIPTEVLESLEQGTPVLHFNQPGTVEAVGPYGSIWEAGFNPPEYPWNVEGFSMERAKRIFSEAFMSLE